MVVVTKLMWHEQNMTQMKRVGNLIFTYTKCFPYPCFLNKERGLSVQVSKDTAELERENVPKGARTIFSDRTEKHDYVTMGILFVTTQ